MAKKTLSPISHPAIPKQEAVTHSLTDTSVAIRCIKIHQAAKLSSKAPGQLTYAVGIDDHTQDLYLQLQDNSSGGYFSREWVPLNHIDACLERLKPNEVFAASHFKPAFVSRSQNNAGFLAAVLKAEGILIPVPDQLNGLQLNATVFKQWRSTLLTLANNAASTDSKDHNPPDPVEKDDDVLDQLMMTD